ncbi:AraC family transcriptional regulator [Saccharibacillus sp. CPCC 101409]|uniref:AraC family transcriptional regulator n=1 Tax=Saccharibacillus sp. CPCC 101409 TaxID=3058041 RepID=UPI002671DFFA|nr:AraC family transcriptional regulator [Saccharibacillus sp. CPCC 101409]MDO3412000.1 AraC family transcriptional regulator [Saccharibacillus sp. CPCC 101409]
MTWTTEAVPSHESFAADPAELTFRLGSVERIACEPEAGLPQRNTSSYVLIACASGEGTVVRENGLVPLRANGLHLCPPDRAFGIEPGTRDGFEMFVLAFEAFREEKNDPARLNAVSEEIWRHAGEAYLPAGRLQALCESLNRRWNGTNPADRMKAGADFLELLGELAACEDTPESDSLALLQRTKVFIDEHYREPIKLEQLAGMAGLSRNYYVDLFKKRYGKSVVEYMTGLRIRRAKRLMTNPGLRMRDVAQQVGYNDEFYFSRRFKKETGVTPSAYVKSRSRRIAAYCQASTGYLLALGIVPHAAPLHPKWAGYYHSRYGGDIPVHLDGYKLGQDWKGNLDRLERSRPELIVCSDRVSAEEKAGLERIARVCYIRSSDDWRTSLRNIAAALGGEAEAEAKSWLDSYAEAASTIGGSIGRRRLGERTLLLRFRRGHFYSAGDSSAADVLSGDLGIHLAALRGPADWSRVPIPLEELEAARADRILLMVCQENETLPGWEAVRQCKRWLELPAVRSGLLHLLSSDPWRECSPSAHKRILREAARIF